MIDPTGAVINILKADSAVVAIAGAKVRGGELAKGDRPPAVIVARITSNRNPGGGGNRRIGLQEVMLQVKCLGATRLQAAQLYGACSDALHLLAPFEDVSGRAIFTVADDVGTSSGIDPGTSWPYEDGTIRVVAAAGALA